ncbi:OmpA family protein [compost metagenome]
MNVLQCFRTLFFVFLISANSCYSQDTLKIYFESAKSTVRPGYEKLLRNFARRIDKENIHFVSITGYADSIGKIRSNLKLSERRAHSVRKICQAYFGDSTTFEMGALGEKAQKADSVSRRVEIVVHYLSSLIDEDILTSQLDSIKANDPRCFLVDFDALKYCNVRYIEKNRKKYVYIQALDVPFFKETKHYFVKNPGAKTAIAQRVNWKLQTTGKLWWKKKRWVATIPKESYDRFQFFVIKNGPCEGCTESLFKKDSNIRTRVTRYSDYFLNDNVQLKSHVFKRRVEKFRVPREFIDPTETTYAYLYRDENYQSMTTVSWEEKKSKRKQDYYFAEIRTRGATTVRFMKTGLETYCPYPDTLKRKSYFHDNWMNCGTGNDRSDRGKKPLSPSLEAGVFYHNDSLTGFVALAARYETGRSLLSLSAGLNTRLGFYGALNYKYYFVTIAIRKSNANGMNGWRIPSNRPIVGSFQYYAGTEARTSFNRSYLSFAETNLHLGMCYESYRPKFFEYSIYLHGGYAKDLLNRINKDFYPFAQLGIVFSI